MASKGLEGPAFNPSEPFGRVFHGEGKPRKSDLECAFFQNGLYYDSDHLLVNNDHNRDILQARNPSVATKAVMIEDEPPSAVPDLSGETDDVVFRMALNLYNKLTRRGDAPDYEPSVEAREENIAFLASHS